MCWCFVVVFAWIFFVCSFCVELFCFVFSKEEELCSYLLGSAKHWSLQFYLYGTACTMNAAAS